MKNEEAKDRLQIIVDKHEVDDIYITLTNRRDYEALKLAIEALKAKKSATLIIDLKNQNSKCSCCEHERSVKTWEWLPAVQWYLKPKYCDECGASFDSYEEINRPVVR